jgi:hypothetical protein
MTNQAKTLPSMAQSLVTGGLGFSAASLCVFATVAFGEGWLYAHVGVLGAYLFWTALFILFGGAVLGRLVVGLGIGRGRLPKFYLLYGIAFFAYAVGWFGAYFTFKDKAGEWVGSAVGSVLMAFVFAVEFGALRSVIKLSGILFIANSLGYFAGSALKDYAGGRIGMLLWGILYGLCLGAGIGAVLRLAQAVSSKQ